MNTQTEKQTYCLGPIVARIAVPECLTGIPGPIVATTYIPTLLLELAIRADLRLNNIPHGLVNSSGTLNRGLITLQTENVGPCLPRLEAILKEGRLWDFTSVYFFDGREGFFRPHHLAHGTDPNFRFGLAELEADVASFTKAIADAATLVSLAVKFSGLNPPPPAAQP